jgi:hypothetical protein
VKIISLNAEELRLKEDGVAGMVIGIALLLLGLLCAAIFSQAGAFGVLIGLAMAGIGGAFILFSSSITVSANRRSGQLWYQKKRLAGSQASVYALTDIACVETRWNMVEQSSSSDGDNYTTSRKVLVAKSLIVLRDGRTLPLTHQKNATRKVTPPMILQVAQFLNVPFREIAP